MHAAVARVALVTAAAFETAAVTVANTIVSIAAVVAMLKFQSVHWGFGESRKIKLVKATLKLWIN